MSKELLEIQNWLKEKSDEKVKASFQKFIPGSEKIYGVKVPMLNELAGKYKAGSFPLVEELWKSGAFEEKLLASKILGEVCKKDAEKTMELLEKFSKDVCDWAVCDTLTTQGIRGIAKEKQGEIFALSRKSVSSKNFWKRRIALVLLINFKKEKELHSEILGIVAKVEDDKEHYVKKAVEWVKREVKKF